MATLAELLGQSTTDRKVDFANIRNVIESKITTKQSLVNFHGVGKNADTLTTTWSESPWHGNGRLGPQVVQLSRTSNLGPLTLSDGDTEVEAHCHLGSILATVCVFEGKWQYEATVGTSGIQQIGWAPLSCPFTNEEGVGDSRDSYAFDGNRVAKWHEGSFPYGQAWVAGDVMGCCLDLDNGNITYYRNGQSMGVAFTKVRKGIGYFPAISLSYGEKCSFNFGRRPYEFPIESYSPLQSPPDIAFSQSIQSTLMHGNGSKQDLAYLIENLEDLLHLELRRQAATDMLGSQEDIIIAASVLFDYLAPSFNEYYVVDLWYPFLVSCMERGGGLLELVVKWLQLLLETFEWEAYMLCLFKYLAFKSRTTGLLQALHSDKSNTLNNPNSFPALSLALELLHVPYILDYVTSLEESNSFIEHFLALKQPSKTDLSNILPFVWWQGGESDSQCSEAHFLHSMAMLNSCIRRYEDLIYRLFAMLRHVGSISVSTGSAAIFFRNWINYIITKNKGANRNVVPPGLSPPSVLLHVYFALARLLFAGTPMVSASSECVAMFTNLFCKATTPMIEFARLGGTLGHLQKTVSVSLVKSQEPTPMEVLMLDAAVMAYHLGVSMRFKASSQQQNSVRQLLARLSDAKKSRESVSDANSELIASVVDELRVMNYSHALLVGDKQSLLSSNSTSLECRQLMKQETMYSMTKFLAELITAASHRTEFVFVPEYYLETMVDAFHSLRRTVPPLPLTASQSPYSSGLTAILSVFVRFFHDPRIVNPDVRDLLLQSIGVLVQYNEYVTCIENLHENLPPPVDEGKHGHETMRSVLVRGLLQVFDKKFWVTVTSILLRLWKGIGVKGQNAPVDSVFRDIFKSIVATDAPLLDSFLNSLFNTLNTTISEFSVINLDVAKMTQNDLRKANFLMELSINLLKILEVVSTEMPQAFTQSELNMTRLVELLLLILIRTTIGPEASRLDGVLIQEPHVSRPWILVPLIGIFLALDRHSQPSSIALIDTLLADGSFKMEAFNYLVEFSWQQATNAGDWLKPLEVFIGKLRDQDTKTKELLSGRVAKSASIELCSICYSAPIDTQFEPCKHASCHKCISRHLLNNTRCFFCNADVASTLPINLDVAE